jgi:hypothetical protein
MWWTPSSFSARKRAWSRHAGDSILESNLTRRIDFAPFMVEALENDELIHKAPAIMGRETPSALAHAAADDVLTAPASSRLKTC